jgi:hypothetical protein
MNLFLSLLTLILILVQLPFGPQPQEEPKEEPSPVKGWWLVKYFGVPSTGYSRSGGIIKAESLGTRSTLYKEVEEKARDHSTLAWKWKISNVVRSAVETKKDRHDAAARVMVVFGREKRYKLFGREPAGLKIEYLWAANTPKGRIFDHPGEKDSKIIVLESGGEKAGQWVFETRNLHNDFREAFKEEPPGLIAIGIQTDTDHSNEQVTAWFSEPILKKK